MSALKRTGSCDVLWGYQACWNAPNAYEPRKPSLSVVEEEIMLCLWVLVPVLVLLRGSLGLAPLPGCSGVRVMAVPRISVVPGCSLGGKPFCLWLLVVLRVLLQGSLGLLLQCSQAGAPAAAGPVQGLGLCSTVLGPVAAGGPEGNSGAGAAP